MNEMEAIVCRLVMVKCHERILSIYSVNPKLSFAG
jgi:hypothetical protein